MALSRSQGVRGYSVGASKGPEECCAQREVLDVLNVAERIKTCATCGV